MGCLEESETFTRAKPITRAHNRIDFASSMDAKVAHGMPKKR
jgi:hypothetical protein